MDDPFHNSSESVQSERTTMPYILHTFNHERCRNRVTRDIIRCLQHCRNNQWVTRDIYIRYL